MISLLTGENSFEIERELERLSAAFDGQVEKVDGQDVELSRLADLLTGTSLFAYKRLVVIKNLSANVALWSDLPQWLERLSPDTDLVLVEAKPDKRTTTFKHLKKFAELKEFKLWSEKDGRQAEDWVMAEAGRLGFDLSRQLARLVVGRVGVNQWRLFHALQKLSAVDELTVGAIGEVVEVSPSENVFRLFETALRGDSQRLHEIIAGLEHSEDPFRVFGLLTTQAFHLAALGVSDRPHAEVAKDFAAHPFVMQKLSPFARRLGKSGTKQVLESLQAADEAMKTSSADPWLMIERALQRVAQK